MPRPSGVRSSISQRGSRSGAPRGSCPGSAIAPLIFAAVEAADCSVAPAEDTEAGYVLVLDAFLDRTTDCETVEFQPYWTLCLAVQNGMSLTLKMKTSCESGARVSHKISITY